MLHKPNQGDTSQQSALPHLKIQPHTRFLVGHGVEAVQDALNGMDRDIISLDNIKIIYFSEKEYELYFARQMWPIVFGPTRQRELEEYTDVINYMLRKTMIRPYANHMSQQDIEKDLKLWKRAVPHSRYAG
ncbi:MAG: hypothetical protein DI585_05120 [Pseudomonas fluorescens]|nr:MAG: hypothetical protein DI585_05120 [Pseudomonas fluorescens]